MKKVLSLVAAIMLLGTTAMAQASFGLGYMTPNHPVTDDALNGFYVGLDYNIQLAGNFYVAPGVYYSSSSKKSSNSFTGSWISYTGELKYNEQYIDVPVNFNYRLPLADDFCISLYAGPTFNYGLSSTAESDNNVSVLGFKLNPNGKVSLYDSDDYKPFDVLVGGGVAFDYASQLRISLGYNYGLLDRNGHDFNRSYLHMGLSYLF